MFRRLNQSIQYQESTICENCDRPALVSTATITRSLTAFMYLGELIEFGQTKDVFNQPANKQTEDYISGRIG
ncbi:MAG: hypothetical protein WBM44_26740 [Waterburya sp.]